jgi:hypothetical protein
MVRDTFDAAFISISHRLYAAGEERLTKYFCDEARQIRKQLIPLSACHPVEPLNGESPTSMLSLSDYRKLVSPTKRFAEVARICKV